MKQHQCLVYFIVVIELIRNYSMNKNHHISITSRRQGEMKTLSTSDWKLSITLLESGLSNTSTHNGETPISYSKEATLATIIPTSEASKGYKPSDQTF